MFGGTKDMVILSFLKPGAVRSQAGMQYSKRCSSSLQRPGGGTPPARSAAGRVSHVQDLRLQDGHGVST